MGFGDHMLLWIRALYTNPCARVNINGVLSDAFPVANGTRQGCPLSPLLFALSLEPFLQAVRSAPDITGLEIGASEHRVAAYADDLLFFVRSPLITLPNLLRLFAEYGALSNLKLNMDKSEILPISVPAMLASSLQSAFPFRWCQGPLKYLGTYLSGNPGDLYTDNYGLLLRSVENDLRSWDLSHITWFGHINAIKMSILPKILYLFQTIPITLPRSFFSTMDGLLRTYVWNGRPPRVKLGLLTTPRSAGGMSMPHVQRYYQASHLQRIVEWGTTSTPKAWVGVEKHFAGPALASVPWVPPRAIPLPPTTLFTTRATLRVWRTLQSQTNIAPFPSPLMPLQHLPVFSRHLMPTAPLEGPPSPLPGHFVVDGRRVAAARLPYLQPMGFLAKF
uniref:Reverse transcriptase domain-containing protein n=1 Tax=Leptobrachium leishanense TaxID=445787 RepID=A0A8C5M3E1_9ANUR